MTEYCKRLNVIPRCLTVEAGMMTRDVYTRDPYSDVYVFHNSITKIMTKEGIYQILRINFPSGATLDYALIDIIDKIELAQDEYWPLKVFYRTSTLNRAQILVLEDSAAVQLIRATQFGITP